MEILLTDTMQKGKKRNELPLLLNDLGMSGRGVEVGVGKGEYSEIILEKSNLSILYSIDSWREFSKEEYLDGMSNLSQEEHELNKEKAINRLSRFDKRSVILQMTSEEAATGLFSDEKELDFVYIDANHSHEACKKDIELWYPKIKNGGILAGHDYIEDGIYKVDSFTVEFGVKSAVDEFVKKERLELFLTEDKPWISWYIIKGREGNIK